MLYKILRGAIMGAFIGIIGGMAILYVSTADRMLTKQREQIQLVEAMAEETDISSVNENELSESILASLESQSEENLMLGRPTDYIVSDNPPECNDLVDVILRFHVRANSNSDEDLAIKYAVRDRVLMEIGEELQGDKSREEVIDYLGENLIVIEGIAKEVIAEAGYDYDVNAYISKDFFPIRQYGELVLPAGEYEALRIDIGEAQGENFWCILYPMMCYTTDEAAVVSRNDGDRLGEELTEEEFQQLFIEHDTGEGRVKFKFKLLEWLGL